MSGTGYFIGMANIDVVLAPKSDWNTDIGFNFPQAKFIRGGWVYY